MARLDDDLTDACDDDTHDHGSTIVDVGAALADEATYRDASELFGAFADPNRLKILDALRTGHEICVSDLIEITGMSQSAVSHALQLLRLRRVVGGRREGRHIYYHLLDDHVVKLIEFALEHLREELLGPDDSG